MSNTELSEEQMAWLAAVRGEGGRLNNLEKWFDTELNYSTRAAANKYKTHINKTEQLLCVDCYILCKTEIINPEVMKCS